MKVGRMKEGRRGDGSLSEVVDVLWMIVDESWVVVVVMVVVLVVSPTDPSFLLLPICS
jgi:hypothetical protein